MALKIGDMVPAFSLKDQEGDLISHEDLLGSPFLIYFYPKDDTPGCTQEACSFRDGIEAFDAQDIVVVGVSADNQASHLKFSQKHELNFPLLCDTDHALATEFGVVKENGGKKSIERSSFLFDEEGLLVWSEKPVKVDGHVERVLEATALFHE